MRYLVLKLWLLLLLLAANHLSLSAQNGVSPVAQPSNYSRITNDVGIGTRVWSLSAQIDGQLANLFQYHLSRRLHLTSSSALSVDLIKHKFFENIRPRYSFTLYQRVGVGTALYRPKSVHSLAVLGGIKYFAYSGVLKNPLLEEEIITRKDHFSPEYGLLYNLKAGRKKHYFSVQVYVPLQFSKWALLENSSIQLGVGTRLN